MNCEEFRARLDAYADRGLSDGEVDEMLRHAKDCPECARELEAAELLRDAMAEIDDGVAVPLAAQAGWREAVRREARSATLKKRMRYGYAVAAALVILLGCTAVFGGFLSRPGSDLPMLAAEPQMNAMEAPAIVVSDGMAPATGTAAEDADATVSAWRKIKAKDLATARRSIEALCEEYGAGVISGEDGENAADRECVYVVELSYDYMEDFLNALTEVGTILDSETFDGVQKTAVIELQILEE